MESVSLSWGNDKHRAELVTQPGTFRLMVNRLHRFDADGEGRVLRAVLGPSTWRRSYADRYVEIRSEAVEGERFHLPYPCLAHTALSMVLRVRTMAQDARNAAAAQSEQQAVAVLDSVLKWDADTLADDGERFRRIYKREAGPPPVYVGPLPPDQQLAIVVQPRDDFEKHVDTVVGFLGKGRPMRRGVYIDAELNPTELQPMLSVVRVKFGGEPIAATLKSPVDADWASLHAAGLTRVYVPLQACRDEDISACHQAGVGLSLLAPAPATLDEAELLAHRANALPLESSDTLYTVEPTPYPYEVERRMALRRAFHHLRLTLRYPPHPAGPMVTHYPLMQSVY